MNNYQDENNYQENNVNNPYDDAYNSSQPVTYEEEKENKPLNYKLIAVIALIVLLLFFIIYFIFFRGKSNGEAEYNKLVTNLCEAAQNYVEDNPELIDTDTPGSTAYIKLEKLSQAYLIESEIKDPRYRKSLFGDNGTKQYIPMTAYIRLAVASNSEVYCEGLVDTGEDKTSPIVSLVGSGEVILAKGTNFEDPGAKATDDMDGDITSKIVRSGTVDITKVGTYTIKYSASDTSGNTTSIERTIIVKEYTDLEPTAASNLDTIAPQIEIKGDNPLCLKLGSTYVEPGVTAVDNKDGNITSSIVVINGVTGNRTGVFRVTYTVEDSAGNKASAYRSVEVKTSCSAVTKPADPTPVNTKPTISLIGGTAVVLEYDEEYIDRGATAWDKEDGSITNKIVVNSSAVNVRAAGIYTVYYEVSDSDGAKATAKRTITVKAPNVTANVATFAYIPTNLKVEVGTPATLDTPTAKDSNGTALTVTQQIKDSSGAVVSEVDYYNVGTYTVVYSAQPTGGVSQTVSRIVTMTDTTSPVVNVPSSLTIQKRTTNCDLTSEDLLNAGVSISDGLNKKMARLRIKATTTDVCKAGTSKVTVDAVDNSGNISYEKSMDVTVSQTAVDSSKVSSVSILNCGSNNRVDMNIGGTYQLSYTVYPTTATNKNVSWKSLNGTVANVTNGLVTASAVGSTDIIITTEDGSKTASCTVVVGSQTNTTPVTDVQIQGCESGELTLSKGKSTTLTAQVLPSTATNKTITWASSNTGVAQINNQGVVTTVNAGTTDLTVTSVDGSKTKICKVTVTNSIVSNDTTAPTKVTLISNSSSATDLYNTSGTWYGGVDKREIKLVVESTDAESKVCRFEVLKADKVIATFNPLTSNQNRGEYTIKDDMNDTISIRAVNCADITGQSSDNITIKLDNSGPNIKFIKSLDEGIWTKEPVFNVEYEGTDAGIGLSHFEYTYDDVKTVKDPVIEGLTETGNKEFYENNTKTYVYVRAVDDLGNVGPWTEKPSYLNMDSVAPAAPTINVTNNNTTKVTVGFAFSDNSSTKTSGFGSFEYKLDDGDAKQIFNEQETFDLTTAKTYKVEVWSYDKAGNKSETSSVKSDIIVKKSSSSSGGSSSGGTSGGGTPTDTSLKVSHSENISSVKDSTATFESNKDVAWTISDKLNYEIVTNEARKLVIRKKFTELTGVKVSWVDGEGNKDSYNLTVLPATPDFICKANGSVIENGSNVEQNTNIECSSTVANAKIGCAGSTSTAKDSQSSPLTCKTTNTSSGTIRFTVSVYGYKDITYSYNISTTTSTNETKLKVTCPKNSIKVGEKITCALDDSTSYEGVELSCYNNGKPVRSFTTTKGDKTIWCKPTESGSMTIYADKQGYSRGAAVVSVKGTSTSPTTTTNSNTSNTMTMSCYKNGSAIANRSHINVGDSIKCYVGNVSGATLSCKDGLKTASSSSSITCKSTDKSPLQIVAKADDQFDTIRYFYVDSFVLNCPNTISSVRGSNVELTTNKIANWKVIEGPNGYVISESKGKSVILQNKSVATSGKIIVQATADGVTKKCTIRIGIEK